MHLHGGSPKPGTDSNEIHAKQVIMGYFGYFSKLLVGTPWETPVHPQDGSQSIPVISKHFCTFYNKTPREPDSPHHSIIKITAPNWLDIVSAISWMCLRSLELVNRELLLVTNTIKINVTLVTKHISRCNFFRQFLEPSPDRCQPNWTVSKCF